jgi:hypothetical protein
MSMRVILHFVIVALGGALWAAAYWLMVACVWLSQAAEKIHPKAAHGNCWSVVLPIWRRRGGYLTLRDSRGARFLNIFPVIHAMWQPEVTGEAVSAIPTRRKTFRWLPLETFYFRFKIVDRER